MSRVIALYNSTIGKKAIAAVTGMVLLGFVIVHALGNLKVFLPGSETGGADIDQYAAALRTVGEPFMPRGAVLWTLRIILAISAVLHVICVTQIALRSRAARPVRYRRQRYLRASFAATFMLVSGLAVFAFLVFHIMHFSTGTIDASNIESGAVYANLYNAFSQWPFVVVYVAAMAFVALHLYHGIWSALQSMGIDNPDRNRALRAISAAIAIAVFVGFVSVPLYFASGDAEKPPAIHETTGANR